MNGGFLHHLVNAGYLVKVSVLKCQYLLHDSTGACSTKEKGKTDEIYEHNNAKQPEAVKLSMAPMQLQKCDSSSATENAREDCGGNKNSDAN